LSPTGKQRLSPTGKHRSSLGQVRHENANTCKLPINPGSDLESLPIFDTPDKIVLRAYAVLIGELLYIAINTVPQLSYSMSSFTRYMSKTTPAHLIKAKVMLRYLIGIKKRQLMWCGQRVCFIQKLIQNGLINVKTASI